MHEMVILQTGMKVTGAMGEYWDFSDPTEATYRARILPLNTETRLAYGQPQGESWYKLFVQGSITVARESQRFKWTNKSDKILIPIDPEFTPDALGRETCVVVKEELS